MLITKPTCVLDMFIKNLSQLGTSYSPQRVLNDVALRYALFLCSLDFDSLIEQPTNKDRHIMNNTYVVTWKFDQ